MAKTKTNLEKKPTQCERVLAYITDFGSITSYEAFIELGIVQLATRIFELKKQGYQFKTTWVDRSNRYNEKVKFKRYELVS